MTEQLSIWRWQIEGDLDAKFAQLLGADADQFTAIASKMVGEDAQSVPSLAQVQAETEAKFRAMGMPDDVLQTALEGFRAMVAEAQEEQAALEDMPAEDDEDDRGGESRVGVTLASSHMFYDEPYAALEHAEIDRQVEAALSGYKSAVSKALSVQGQGFADYLGVTSEVFYSEETLEILLAAGFEGAEWVWIHGDVAYYLTHWHEDKELPIDLEFHRAPAANLDALKGQI